MLQRERKITLRFLAEPADLNFEGMVRGVAVMNVQAVEGRSVGDVCNRNRREDSAGWSAQESRYRGGDRQLHRVVRLYALRLPGGRDRTALLPGGEPSGLAHGDLRGLRGGG